MSTSIYKLICKCNLIYIGSTSNYIKRLWEHKCIFINNTNKKGLNYHSKLYTHLRNCCDNWDDIKSEELLKFDSDDGLLKKKIERHYIDINDSFNNGLNDQLPNPNDKETRRLIKNSKVREYMSNKYNNDEEYKKIHVKTMKNLYHTVYKKQKIYCEVCDQDVIRLHYPGHTQTAKHKINYFYST